VTLAFVVAVVFLATVIRSSIGFGEALIAVPILAFVLPVTVAAPVAVLVSITVAAIVVAQDWRHVQWRSAAALVAATLVGIPAGILILRGVPERIVKVALGAIVAAFALATLRRPRGRALTHDRHAWLFGVVAGVLGGAYGMNGPPLVIYGTLRQWQPAQFRATLQGYFLPASVVGMAAYAIAGLWTPVVTHYYLVSLPFTCLAIWLGRALHQRLAGDRFFVYVNAALLASGIGLIVQALVAG
jgi:uncharacterized membrane protein YfcA